MRVKSFLLLLALGLFGSSLAGCGDDDDGPVDSSTDVTTDADADAGDTNMMMECTTDFVADLGDETGHADPLNASATEARAGRLAAGDVPPDPLNLAVIQAGDYVLANDKIAVVIEAPGASDLYDPWGGKVIGLGRVEGGAIVQAADFNELIIGTGRFTPDASSVTVMNDGSDGNAAVIRVVGFLRAIPFIDSFASAITRFNYDDLEVAVDYTLEPGAEQVTVRYTYMNERPSLARIDPFLLIFQKYRMPEYAPELGFTVPMGSSVPWVGFVDDENTSWAYESPNDNLLLFIELSGVLAMREQAFNVEPCSEFSRETGVIHVGGPGVDGLREAIARNKGEASTAITGTVREADGSPAAGVRVHATEGTSYLTRSAVTGADGAYTLHVPAAAGVELTAFRRGTAIATTPSSSPDIMLQAVGTLRVQVVDPDLVAPNNTLPSRVQVLPVTPVAEPPQNFGEEQLPYGGRLHIDFTVSDGEIVLPVPAGEHRVVVSRGYEYEIFDENVTVTADAETMVLAELSHVVDSTDQLCGDWHIHTHRSPDSADSPQFKIRAAAGDGVELPIRTDHEWVNGFEATISELGLTDFAYGASALELTTFEWGHMGVFPLEPDFSLVNDGAVVWTDGNAFNPPDVFDDARSRPGDPTVIIFHPRSATGFFAYFSAVGYDPDTGTVENPEMWDEEWTLLEAFNDSDFDANRDGTVKDWFSFLNAGRRVFTVGSSDSHLVYAGAPVGYPRTCVRTGHDDIAMARAAGAGALRDLMLDGHHVVSGGILVSSETATGEREGDTATGVGTTAMVRVRVQAPSWIDVDSLEVYVDGALADTIPLAGATDVMRFDDDIAVEVAPTGSYVVFHAKGDQPLDPVHAGRTPFGVTNPIFLER